MNKINSPSSNNSATSSETSETQSVEENIIPGSNGNQNRATKNWKSIKEASDKESKRPPWRMVSVSTLPKADKNALLKAKLLDASRRMRAGKINIGIQTEQCSTQMMKEVNIDVQHDLIEMADKGILTDGLITLKNENPGEFILTHSVAQMTSGVLITDEETQTVIPRMTKNLFGNSFDRPKRGHTINDLGDKEFAIMEQKYTENVNDELKFNENSNKLEEFSDFSDDSITTESKDTPNKWQRSNIRQSFIKPTLSCWYFDSIETIGPKKSKYYRPWGTMETNEKDQFGNMQLLPLSMRKQTKLVQQGPIVWTNNHIIAISNLIDEANALTRAFEEFHLLHASKIRFKHISKQDDPKITFPSSYWQPILKKSRMELQAKVASLKYPIIKKVEPINLESITEFNLN